MSTTTNPFEFNFSIGTSSLLSRANLIARKLKEKLGAGFSVNFLVSDWNSEYYPYDFYFNYDPVSYPDTVRVEIYSPKAILYLENLAWVYSTTKDILSRGDAIRRHQKFDRKDRRITWGHEFPLPGIAPLAVYTDHLRTYSSEVQSLLKGSEFLKEDSSAKAAPGYQWSFGAVPKIPVQESPSIASLLSAISCKKGEFVTPPYYELVKNQVMKRGRHVQVMGPPGVGKSFFIEKLAEQEGKTLVNLNCDGKVGRNHIEGVREIKNGTSYFSRSSVAEAIVKGHWVKLDELNMAEPDAIVSLNGIIAPPFKINLDNKQYDVHPDFRLFITYNPGLTGTKALPESLEDRLFPIIADHPHPVVCGKILVSNGVDPEVSLRLSRFASSMWSLYREKKVRYALSIRRLIDAGGMLEDGYGWEESLNYSLLNLVRLPSDQVIIKDLITKS